MVTGLICLACGEEYDFKDFEKQELEHFEDYVRNCGECGCMDFVFKSQYSLEGFQSLEHYLFHNNLSSKLMPQLIKGANNSEDIKNLSEMVNRALAYLYQEKTKTL
ncbi:MAG: hypothetical protein Q7S33_05785 [Nanoarchaeota archaeon]|nr:hypothetical protein [Nanoarchaeota archaeon]